MTDTLETKGDVAIALKPVLPPLIEPSFSFAEYSAEETQKFIGILHADPTIQFLKKRDLVIPVISDSRIEEIFGQNSDSAKMIIGYLVDFMHAVPIADRFTDHSVRNGWKKKMIEEQGVRFFDFYNDYNQLKVNNLQRPLGIELLANIAHEEKHNPLFNSLKHTHAELMSAMTGHRVSVEITEDGQNKDLIISAKGQLGDAKNYHERDLEGKLRVVHFFEDKIVGVLNKLSGEQQK